jgi:uncharacterized damage-inducible protein DinB
LTSSHARTLALRLRKAADALIAVIEPIDDDRWHRVPGPGTWSIGKEAEHVAQAAGYHQWIVRLTIGQKVPARRPVLERRRMTSALSPHEAAELIRERLEDGVRLLLDLTDAQLDLSTRPPRANAQVLADTIERVLIGHFDTHRAAIEEKLRARRRQIDSRASTMRSTISGAAAGSVMSS